MRALPRPAPRIVVCLILFGISGSASAFAPTQFMAASRIQMHLSTPGRTCRLCNYSTSRGSRPMGARCLDMRFQGAAREKCQTLPSPGSSAIVPRTLLLGSSLGSHLDKLRALVEPLATAFAVFALSFLYDIPVAFAASAATSATPVGWAPVAKKVALFVLGFVALLPVASRVARWAAGFLSPVGRALLGRDDCISVTCTNVVLSGSEAGLLQKRFQELSFKRDELADRMRWAVRNDVTVGDARLTVGEGVEDGMGEAAVARQAARMLLSAKQSGGWVAGKVGVNSFLLSQTTEGQEEFFTQCASARGMMGQFDGAKLARNRPEGSSSKRVERLRQETEKIREAAERVQSTRTRGASGLLEDRNAPPLPNFPRPKAGVGAAYGYVDEKPAEKPGQGVQSVASSAKAGVQGDKLDQDNNFMIATIVTATVGPRPGGGQGEGVAGPTTSAALEEISKLTAEQLLSLEVLWLPAEGDRWLSKEEVLMSLDISRAKGFASAQRLDLFGPTLF